MSKRSAAVYLKDGTPLYGVGGDAGASKCAKLQLSSGEDGALCAEGSSLADELSASDTEDLFSALMQSDCTRIRTPRPSLRPDARVKFRTQFNEGYEGTLVEYAVYRVFEEFRLSGQSPPVRAAQDALEELLRAHFPGRLTLDAVPFLSGGAFRLAFGKDARLDDFQIATTLRCFSKAKNQLGTVETMRTLALTLMREQLMTATTVVLDFSDDMPTLLTDGDKYTLLREAVVMSKGFDWLDLLPQILYPGDQRIPAGLHAPDSAETLLEVWVEKSRAPNKLAVLLQTQIPTRALQSRFITISTPILRRRLDEMAVGDANVYNACVQCYWLIHRAIVRARVAGAKKEGA